MKQSIYIQTIVFMIFTTIVKLSLAQYPPAIGLDEDDEKYIVSYYGEDNSEKYITAVKKMKAGMARNNLIVWKKYAIVSEDYKSLAVLCLTSDTADRVVYIHNITDDSERMVEINRKAFRISRLLPFKWVTNSHISFPTVISTRESLLLNIENGQKESHTFSFDPDWDSTATNRCEYYYNEWAIGLKRFIPSRKDMTMYIRYNGYWIYPQIIDAPMSYEDYFPPKKWNDERTNQPYYFYEHKAPAASIPKENACVRLGKNTTETLVFSQPAFVGDTSSFSFIENIFAIEDDKVNLKETNIVVMDVDSDKETPPKAEDIHYVKTPIKMFADPKNSNQWADYAVNHRCLWNAENNEMRVYKRKGDPTVPGWREEYCIDPDYFWILVAKYKVNPETKAAYDYEILADPEKYPWSEWVPFR